MMDVARLVAVVRAAMSGPGVVNGGSCRPHCPGCMAAILELRWDDADEDEPTDADRCSIPGGEADARRRCVTQCRGALVARGGRGGWPAVSGPAGRAVAALCPPPQSGFLLCPCAPDPALVHPQACRRRRCRRPCWSASRRCDPHDRWAPGDCPKRAA